MTRYIALIAILFATQPLSADEGGEEAAPEIGFDGKIAPNPFLDAVKYLERSEMQIGMFPNLSGFIDLRAHIRLSASIFSTGLYVDYLTYGSRVKLAKLESNSVRKDFIASFDAFKIILPLIPNVADRILFSLEPGINARYFNYTIEESGFRINPDETTTYFRLDRTFNQLSFGPILDLSLILGDFTLDVRGEYSPILYIAENGNRNYSTFEQGVSYSSQNRVSAFRISGGLNLPLKYIIQIPLGDILVNGEWTLQQGKYASQTVVLRGNLKTTINEFKNLERTYITMSVFYRMSFLKGPIGFIPSVGLIHQWFFESYFDPATEPNPPVSANTLLKFAVNMEL